MRNFIVPMLIGCALATPVSASRIVYLAEQDYAFVNELYIVDLTEPGESMKLNRPLSPFARGVTRFAISPDGGRIVYSADQNAVADSDLYLVDITRPGTWTRLGDLPGGYEEIYARFSPDGSKIAFTASDASFANTQLYLVDLESPSDTLRMNADLAQDGAVSMSGFAFTPDGSHLIYVAGELERKFELYAVSIDAPRQTVRLNAPGGSVGDTWEGRFQILPDSRRVVYSAVWQNPGVRELHLVSIDAPGQPVTLNAAFQPDGYLFDYALSPDGHYVSYTADQDSDSLHEVYVVIIDVPGSATKINGPVQGGASLARFTPDSSHLIYAADEQRGLFQRDLFMVASDQPENRIRLNAQLSAGEDIDQYVISSDGTQLVYRPTPPGGVATELMVLQLDSPGSAVTVNGPLPNGGLDFLRPRFSPSGEEIGFLAYESAATSITELFYARVAEPGTSVRINRSLPKDGVVAPTLDSFAFLPTGAPPTGAPPTGEPDDPSGNGPVNTESGGGAIGWEVLLLLFAALINATRTSKRHCGYTRRRYS